MAQPYKLVKRVKSESLIFEGRNTNTARRVIIQLASGADESALLQRLGLARHLNHPNTARILDAGVVAHPVRVGYVVREFAPGVSLSEILKLGALGADQSFAVIRQVLDSLAEAHAVGVYHGRLVPEHVIVSNAHEPGKVHAKLIGYWTFSDRPSAESGEYSPADATPSVAGDVHAAAKLLLRCLTGTTSIIRGLSLLPRDSTRLRTVIRRATSAQSATAFSSAEQFRQALEDCCRGESIQTWQSIEYTQERPRLTPDKHRLMSVRAPSIWVLEGDPAISSRSVKQALHNLRGMYPVRMISESERQSMADELLRGTVQLPWVVVFGGMSVLVDDPLLSLLSTSVELSRLLISSHDNLELLQGAFSRGGLDGHVSLPSEGPEIVTKVETLIGVTKRVNNHYDAIRLALRKAHERVDKLSHAIAADEAGATRADSLSHLRAIAGANDD
jgi:hypothetical protein